MELKLVRISDLKHLIDAFNRTNMELKPDIDYLPIIDIRTF